MATSQVGTKVKVIEQCRVGPPPGSVAETSLPLSFFDVPWLNFLPVKAIFFFELTNSTSSTTSAHDFLTTDIPNLKKSLSLALQQFYPLVGTLALSPDDDQTGEPKIQYYGGADGDHDHNNSVALTVAESCMDFNSLVADSPKDTSWFHPLVPELPNSDLISFQVTVFPDSGGFAIAHTVHHVAGDGSSIIHFMKHWASICRLGHQEAASAILQPPICDRSSTVPDPTGIKRFFLDLVRNIEKQKDRPKQPMVIATFVMGRAQIEELRQRAAIHHRYSSFVVTCAYVWVCLTKAREVDLQTVVDFIFSADCRGSKRMDPPIPVNYFGNCLVICPVSAKVGDIITEDGKGFGEACELIRKEIERLDEDDGNGDMKGSGAWFVRIVPKLNDGDQWRFSVAGSPRIGFYDMDFGHGRPRKVEMVSIEDTGAASLTERRSRSGGDDDGGGGIEVGLALPEHVMERFANLYEAGLKRAPLALGLLLH